MIFEKTECEYWLENGVLQDCEVKNKEMNEMDFEEALKLSFRKEGEGYTNRELELADYEGDEDFLKNIILSSRLDKLITEEYFIIDDEHKGRDTMYQFVKNKNVHMREKYFIDEEATDKFYDLVEDYPDILEKYFKGTNFNIKGGLKR